MCLMFSVNTETKLIKYIIKIDGLSNLLLTRYIHQLFILFLTYKYTVFCPNIYHVGLYYFYLFLMINLILMKNSLNTSNPDLYIDTAKNKNER